MYEKLTKHSQGRRHNLKSGGTNITASEAGRKKFGGCAVCYTPECRMWGTTPNL